MNKSKYIITTILVFILFIILLDAAYIVNETEQVIITMFGKPIGQPITDAGLHFKLPYFHKTNFLTSDFWPGMVLLIKFRPKISVSSGWILMLAGELPIRCSFFQRLRDERSAQSRLDDILDGETRNAIANHDLVEIIRTSNRPMEIGDLMEYETESDVNFKIKVGREKITRLIIETALPPR